jgi:DNA-binding CsgD family transcriptional regulator
VHTVLRCEALNHAGRFDDGESLAEEQYRLALQQGSLEAQAYFAWQLSTTVCDRGRVSTAIRYGREAVALSRQLDRLQLLALCLTHVALAFALSGNVSEARHALSVHDDLDIPSNVYFGVDLMQARAWTAVAAGNLSQARTFLEEAVSLATKVGDLVGQAAALHGLARIGFAEQAVTQLGGVADAEGELIQGRISHVRGLAARDPEALAQASETFDRLGASLLGAEAAADAAVAYRRAGNLRQAKSAERRSQSLADLCDGATTPALQAVEARVRLTQAERGTALLAAKGLSNKQIAKDLYVSIRTVEGQLQRVYHKLGISCRAELAAALDTDVLKDASKPAAAVSQ